jgi:hypothetical protein
MTNKPATISDTARALLTAAATRGDYFVRPPKLPTAAARQVIRSLLNARLVEEVPAPIDDAEYAWRSGQDGGVLMLRATALGIAHALEGNEVSDAPAPVGSVAGCSADRTTVQAGDSALIATPSAVDPCADATRIGQAEEDKGDINRVVTVPVPELSAEASEAASKPARPARRADGLGRAAQALLDAWDNAGGGDVRLDEVIGPITALRAALAVTVDGSVSPTHCDRDQRRNKRRSSRCSAVRKAPAGCRSLKRWAGRPTPSAASWPASPRKASRSKSSSGPPGWAQQTGRERQLHGLPHHRRPTSLSRTARWGGQA